MKQSHLFTKTRKEAPKDEVSKNAQLLIRAGYIHKEMAGIYSYLPLGLRVLKKIEHIIREEMNALSGQEVLLTVLQDKALWEKTNRWSDEVVDNWFKTKLKNDTEVGLGHTHEEELTHLLKDYIRSWRDLPTYVYQIQTKFRNEARAKSGIMRGREFLMKDLYSFSRTEEEHAAFYERAKVAYKNVFKRVGIGESTYMTFASGGTFSKYSHEFQTLTEAGEDTIHICEKCKVAVNAEIIKEVSACPECTNKNLITKKAVEVGNIFNLGTRFSVPFELTYAGETGEKKPVIMGCYGIGLGRVMGTVVEVFADEKGIVWPEAIAPFRVHLISLAGDNESVKKYADALYEKLLQKGVEVLYDERDLRAGEKFADSDLLGIPLRAVISEKLLAEKNIEIKERTKSDAEKISEEAFFVLLGK
ncbi:MAG TPA: aminoacyl--tRNA ligase-related protein [Candidatus Paceibacterota bacterium]